MFSFNLATHILVKDKDSKESKMKIPCRYVLIWDHDVMHASRYYSKLNYRLFFKLAYAENKFLFGDDDSKLKLSALYKFCGKDFGSKKAETITHGHAQRTPKEMKTGRGRIRRGGRVKTKKQVRNRDSVFKIINCLF